jgi:hypothetical protein
MPNNDHADRIGGRKLVAIVAVVVALAFFIWGPTNTHVASNPGPSGIPESTIVNPPPPPASSPSGITTGTAR